MLDYVGIAGSDRNFITNQEVSSRGTFVVDQAIKLTAISDGTSNTMIVGESSGLARGQRANNFGGGSDTECTWPLADVYSWMGVPKNWCYNVKTVAFPPNGPYFWPTNTGPGGPTYDPGFPLIPTVPRSSLKSQHTGGFNALFGDGSVHFINQSIDLNTLKNLADRADGNILGNY